MASHLFTTTLSFLHNYLASCASSVLLLLAPAFWITPVIGNLSMTNFPIFGYRIYHPSGLLELHLLRSLDFRMTLWKKYGFSFYLESFITVYHLKVIWRNLPHNNQIFLPESPSLFIGGRRDGLGCNCPGLKCPVSSTLTMPTWNATASFNHKAPKIAASETH